jgi:hypothetical protein
MKKILKIAGIVAVVVTIVVLALELRQARYELRLEQDTNRNWHDTSSLQWASHARIMVRDRQEIARLQAQATNAIAAH